MKRFFALGLFVAILALSLFGCAPKGLEGDREITDLLGRRVTVPTKIERVVCIGAGALRLYSYVGDMEKLCGVEACEGGFLISARPYQIVNEKLFKSLPTIGAGGPGSTADAESIIAQNPDVIFSLYNSDPSQMDKLAQKTGIPVVVLSYGKTEAFDQSIIKSLTLMGEILNRTDRAKAVCDYIGQIEADLKSRTADVKEADKKTVYIGCQSNYGTHGIGSSSANYSIFDSIGARNVLDEAGFKGYQGSIDRETLLSLDPEIIIIDGGGLSVLKEEYLENKGFFQSLTAVKNLDVYVQMPYNAYYTNLEIAYANCYFAGKCIFPQAFSDVDPADKFDEISTFFLGEACYDRVSEEIFGGYQRLDWESLFND